MKKNGLLASGVLWFGAAVSIAEIEAGCQIAGNWLALWTGHLFGGLLLFAVGLLGARARQGAMALTGDAFGAFGRGLFTTLNVLQLIGWTAVMIAQGASALHALTGVAFPAVCVGLTVLVLVWTHFDLARASVAAVVCVGLLAFLSSALTVKLTVAPAVAAAAVPRAPLGFWAAFEVSVAMPLSWLPLISDYTKDAERPVAATAVSTGAYLLVSTWMFTLGMLIVTRGNADLVSCLSHVGGPAAVAGLGVIVLSTLTTTFMDIHSSGESVQVLVKGLSPKVTGWCVGVIGCVLAIVGLMARYCGFLYAIASVFAPMAAVLLVAGLRRRRGSWLWNLFAWLVGSVVYQLSAASPVGPTLTALAVSAALALVPVDTRR